MTRRPRYITETVPNGPDAILEVEDVRQHLLATCRSNHGQGGTTVAELTTRHILLLALSETTRERYFELDSTHIVPMIGHVLIRDLTPETLEDCYAQLLCCRDHCVVQCLFQICDEVLGILEAHFQLTLIVHSGQWPTH
ncbi:hypothetical protein ACFFQW_41100 [Umezawaea endophytica]|uniref:Uncharacterized protein n=1 Tax=Umezawaea endophytica TaxID=1654476 RepID=A0A9X3ALL5_9PSEU|nr:hypothetical protein [Umezawaea endophytica]MCS7484635.1 hypothetical protein [Umezawaea endophytica]